MREILLEELDLRTVVGKDVRVRWVAADEVLVLGLGGVEAIQRDDGGDDAAGEDLQVTVDQVRQWPGGRKVRQAGQRVPITVPETASIEGIGAPTALSPPRASSARRLPRAPATPEMCGDG